MPDLEAPAFCGVLFRCSVCREVVEGLDGTCSSDGGKVLAEAIYRSPSSRPNRRVSMPRASRRRTIDRLCRFCEKVAPHAPRADRPDEPRDRCLSCSATYLREWREKNWQRAKLRNTYKGMIARCHDPEAMQRWARASGFPKYRDYGEAGISVCERWRDAETGFASFAADVGPPPTPAHTLDRIRPSRNYGPSNCRWSTPDEQARNRKNARRIVARDAETGDLVSRTLSEWGRVGVVSRATIAARLAAGIDPTRAVYDPPAKFSSPPETTEVPF